MRFYIARKPTYESQSLVIKKATIEGFLMKLLPFGNYSVGHIIAYEKSLVYPYFRIQNRAITP